MKISTLLPLVFVLAVTTSPILAQQATGVPGSPSATTTIEGNQLPPPPQKFNSTALCSPTRAALITGRNLHSMGFGVISEQSTGYPGYNSVMSRDKATIGKILKDHGYWTSWFGKDHNTPEFQASAAGASTLLLFLDDLASAAILCAAVPFVAHAFR